jgi:hypothetical protein
MSQLQESFRSLQLFGAGAHKIQGSTLLSTTGELQSLSTANVLLQPQAGPGHFTSAGYRDTGIHSLAWFCMVCWVLLLFLAETYDYPENDDSYVRCWHYWSCIYYIHYTFCPGFSVEFTWISILYEFDRRKQILYVVPIQNIIGNGLLTQ